MDLFKTQPCKYFLLWFNFIFGLSFIFLCFELIIRHYHTQKRRKIKFKPEIKLNHNIYMDWGNPIQNWRVNCTNSKILWHLWLQSFGTCNCSLENAKIYVSLYSFCFLLFWIWRQFLRTGSRGLYLEGRFIGGFFVLQIWGAYTCIWRGVYIEGLIFGILQ